jgi:hypothetical protein
MPMTSEARPFYVHRAMKVSFCTPLLCLPKARKQLLAMTPRSHLTNVLDLWTSRLRTMSP